ncbi:DUF342 domain-containing protein [Laribacter hongkongensis]|uniref:DUF342 domain-containing protein n=1 Tax=Laribacter hongkongensis TaxID=168471 RepID=UPI001EFDB4CA|nr:FapA family protein [Laribacter hongkongensis]MCG9097357.1 FapA family protein [Laribacter hongkongensis]
MTSPTGLDLGCEGRKIIARYLPGDPAAAPTRDALQALLVQQKWHTAALDEVAIEAFLKTCQESAEEGNTVIGELHDGSFEISVSSDAMTAWLTLRLPMGGQAVDPRRVIQSLQDHGVVYGLQTEALRTALTSGHCEHLVVAVGCPAGHGERTRFVNLVEDRMADVRGDSSELARVDYRAMGHLHLVDRGVQLMRRIPASQGVPGMNVLGQAVAAVPVPDLPFERGLSGVDVASNDPDVLVSTLAGAPSFLEKGVKVLPVIEVDEVGLDSGHIEFDGTLHVKGDIRAGMRVVAGGDVVVSGAIEAAEVRAGGNVSVKGGIIGKLGSQDTALIRAGGSIEARFVEGARLSAETTVKAERGIQQSHVEAGHSILVGNQGSLGGGQYSALRHVQAGVLGLPTGVATMVQVGYQPGLIRRRDELEHERKARLDEFGKVLQVITFCKQNPEHADQLEKARRTAGTLKSEVDRLTLELAELNDKLTLAADAAIVALKQIYCGVELRIGQKRMTLDEERRGGSARLKGSQVVIE